MALVKHNNNSISAVTSMASLTTGAMTLIKEQTASSSASISFVDGSNGVVLDSTYPIYKFEFINIHPATNATIFSFQGSTNGGSSYGITITSTAILAQHDEADTSTALIYNGSKDLAQSTSDQVLINEIGNGSDESGSGNLFLFNPSSTTFVKHWLSRTSGYQADNYIQDRYFAGYFNNTSAIDAIIFRMSSGNIDSGTIKLYGIKDS
jgi:hypothetical protein